MLRTLLEVARAAAGNSAAKDVFAVLVAALAGFAVLLYAASSDLFDLKLFKFDPSSFRLPKEAKVEFWYVRAARRFETLLTGGGWSYAKIKKRTRVAVKREGRRLRKETRRRLPDAVGKLNRDIALGALAIAITLVALLLLRLF